MVVVLRLFVVMSLVVFVLIGGMFLRLIVLLPCRILRLGAMLSGVGVRVRPGSGEVCGHGSRPALPLLLLLASVGRLPLSGGVDPAERSGVPASLPSSWHVGSLVGLSPPD